MKIQAIKNDPERTFQEMADILFLLRLPETNEDKIKTCFSKQGLIEQIRDRKSLY